MRFCLRLAETSLRGSNFHQVVPNSFIQQPLLVIQLVHGPNTSIGSLLFLTLFQKNLKRACKEHTSKYILKEIKEQSIKDVKQSEATARCRGLRELL